MDIVVRQLDFDGPLDLMLQLIQKNKLDLMDLDLEALTSQYIQAIDAMVQANLDIASEYLTELAGLVELKSKRLLPNHKNDDLVDELKEEDLVQRLLDYQAYKEAALDLEERFVARQRQYALWSYQHDFEEEISYRHDIYDLIKAMGKLLARTSLKNSQPLVLTSYEYSVDDCLEEVRVVLSQKNTPFKLEELFEKSAPIQKNIATFLAILDLIRMQEVYFTIDTQNQIYLRKNK